MAVRVEKFKLEAEKLENGHWFLHKCDNQTVLLDISIFSVEAFDNMGLYNRHKNDKAGVYEVTGELIIDDGEVHYTTQSKFLRNSDV